MTSAPALVVVLTGGTARRLGGVDKTGLDVGGRSVLQRLLDAVGAVPVVVVGPGQDVGRTVVRAREDPPLGGPYAGVAAGVAAGVTAYPATEVVVVLAGDQPFAGAAVASLCAGLDARPDADAALAVGPDGRPQPLLAAYRLAAVRERLAGGVHGRPVRELAAGLRTVLVPVDAGTALDVDDAADLEAARRLAAAAPGGTAVSPPPDPAR